VDVFNVLNSDAVQNYDENYTFDSVAPSSGIDCDARDSAGKKNPIAAVQKACPNLKYLKTVDGNQVSVNPNWGKPLQATTAFQAPLSARLSVALSF
jgi:hypothetical protein